jgi:hypothetical protein
MINNLIFKIEICNHNIKFAQKSSRFSALFMAYPIICVIKNKFVILPPLKVDALFKFSLDYFKLRNLNRLSKVYYVTPCMSNSLSALISNPEIALLLPELPPFLSSPLLEELSLFS